MRLSSLSSSAALAVVLLVARESAADPPNFHLTAATGTPLGNPQAHEFGFGAGGSLAAELPVGKIVGFQIEASALWLAHTNPPADPRIADHGDGTTFGAMAGVRLHPMGGMSLAGLWLDVNGGYVNTGSLSRGGFETHLGYDARVGRGRWDVGPFVGYMQVFQSKDALRPDDAHLLTFGVHVALGRAPEPPPLRGDRDQDGVFDDEDACPDVPGIRTSDPRTNGCPRGDRDRDGIFDDEDACPDVPGIRTNDPKTNGCPRPDRDKDGVFDDEDACPDTPGVRTTDPKTNGCPPPAPPPPDRDGDGVPDAEDACPDIPGIKTNDPKTNGCPASTDVISVFKDQILLKEQVLFETNVGRVRHYSWPLVQKLAAFLNANPDFVEVSIEGHTDEVGGDAYNDFLSQERADMVKVLLVRFGVDANRLKTKGFGKRKPLSDGHDEAAHQQNRRVQFIITRLRTPQGGVAPIQPQPSPAPNGGP